ncbi:MAG: cytochrome P450 [Microscillaceae bacterium]|nr:cytochrome P450 [Microscillaceae bacterium]
MEKTYAKPKPFQQKFSRLNHIPGELGLPFFGHIFSFIRDPFGLFDRKKAQYGNIFKIRILGNQVLVIMGKDANQFVLVEEAKYFSSKQAWEVNLGELFPGGLMLRDGEDHKFHRSILQSAFKKDPMNAYLEAMIPVIEQFFKGWQSRKEVNIFHEIKELTLYIAGKVFFGIDLSGELKQINKAIIDIVKASTTALPFAIPFTPYWRGLQGRKVLERYFMEILQDRRKSPTKDMLGTLCTAENDEGDRLSDWEIINHMIFILMAGHDTTASTLTSLFYELAKHPDWQEKLREESRNFYAQGSADFNRLSELSLLDYAIKETLRMHPPLILIPRVATESMEFEGHHIPKNTQVIVMLYQTHYEDQIFAQPQQFDPMRFAQDRAEHKKCSHAFAPFGAGKHHCVGFAFAEMQIKLVISHALTHYRWSVPQGYQMPYQPVPLQEPKDGLPVKLERID